MKLILNTNTNELLTLVKKATDQAEELKKTIDEINNFKLDAKIEKGTEE